MRSFLPTLVLLFCLKHANCAFYPKSHLHNSGTNLATTRGGAGEEKPFFGSLGKITTKLNDLRSVPIDKSTESFIGSLQSIIGSLLVLIAVTRIPDIYPLQKSFKDMAASECAKGHSTLFAYPSTLSASIMIQDQYNGRIVGGLFMMSAILLMNSKMGLSTTFPSQTGYFGAIFDTIRWFIPSFTLFMIPHVPMNLEFGRQDEMHVLLALPTFFILPILEMIISIDSIVRFLKTDPWGAEFLPCDDERVAQTTWCKKVYRYLWLSLTFLRLVICLGTSYTFFAIFSPVQGKFNYFPALTDCDALKIIKSFFSECLGIEGFALIIFTLNLSQMCESASGQLAPLAYVLPSTVYLFNRLRKTFVPKFLALFSLKESYLKLVGIPDGVFIKDVQTYIQDKAGVKKCSAILNNLGSCDIS